MEEIHKKIADLSLLMAIESYPRLDNLQYFRKLNLFIEYTLNEKLEETKGNNKGGTFNLQMLQELSERKNYMSFQNLIRPSLLITLCSFIESIFTYRVNSDEKFKKQFNALKKSKKASDLNIAKKVLIDNGFEKLNNMNGTKFVDDMNWIRNKFVHNKVSVKK